MLRVTVHGKAEWWLPLKPKRRTPPFHRRTAQETAQGAGAHFNMEAGMANSGAWMEMIRFAQASSPGEELAKKLQVVPFSIIVDNREQHPFTFTGFRSSASTGSKPIAVTCVRRHLPTGDYSIDTLEAEVTIERKSHEDLAQTLIYGRDRFRAELERMKAMRFSAVVVEAGMGRLSQPLPNRKIHPNSLLRSIQSLAIDYPTQWFACPTRRFAEEWTYQLLEMYWRKRTKVEPV